MKRFQSSMHLHSSSLFWSRVKQIQQSKPPQVSLAEVYALMDEERPKMTTDLDSMQEALDKIAAWSKKFVADNKALHEQIRSEG